MATTETELVLALEEQFTVGEVFTVTVVAALVLLHPALAITTV